MKRAKKVETSTNVKPPAVGATIHLSKRLWDEITEKADRVYKTSGVRATPEEIAAVLVEMGLACTREKSVANGDPTLFALAKKHAGVIE